MRRRRRPEPELTLPPAGFVSRTGVSRSPIHGLGCFAAEDLPRGCLATWYDGELVDWPTARRRRAPGHYIRSLESMHSAVDGCRDPRRARGHGSFCNHADRPNAAFWVRGGVVWIKTLRPVAGGEELTVSYGRSYAHG